MTHSISLRAKLQKKLSPSVKGGSEKFSDFGINFGIITGFINENIPVVNENGVLSGNGDSVILQRRFGNFATAIW